MNILLIEDDENKARHVEELVREVVPAAAVEHARSFNTGLRALTGRRWDLILLDMTLPAYDPVNTHGNRVRPYAGKQLLYQMRLREIATPVIVITQFDVFGQGSERRTLEQLREELAANFGGHYMGLIYYSPAESVWRQLLAKLLHDVG